jgi:hypothetical protein
MAILLSCKALCIVIALHIGAAHSRERTDLGVATAVRVEARSISRGSMFDFEYNPAFV